MTEETAPKPPTAIEALIPLAAVGMIETERVISDGQLLLDPNQSNFRLKWGSVDIRAAIVTNDIDIKSTFAIDGLQLNVVLNTIANSDFYVKFKNVLRYGGNSSHLSIFMRPQAGVDRPARLVSFTISSTPERLP